MEIQHSKHKILPPDFVVWDFAPIIIIIVHACVFLLAGSGRASRIHLCILINHALKNINNYNLSICTERQDAC